MSAPTPKKPWRKPELTRLGKLTDVAGNKVVNFNGVSINLKS